MGHASTRLGICTRAKIGQAWFNMPAHTPSALAQTLVKSADDTRALVAVTLGEYAVVLAMIGLGLLCAR